MVNNIERNANLAVKKLRLQKLSNNIPFMINTDKLPPRHCYLAYADGKIEIVFLPPGSTRFAVIRELTKKEADELRRKCNVL